jgi:transcriptional regulator with XRE-family HTH domain
MNSLEIFAGNLKSIRKKKGFSQEKLGFASNIDRTYVQLIEAKKANPSLKVIEKLADALEISLIDFFKR